MTNTNAIYLTMVKSGKTTYLVDLKEAKNGNRYLSISENSVQGEERKRQTVRFFGDTIEQLRKAMRKQALRRLQSSFAATKSFHHRHMIRG